MCLSHSTYIFNVTFLFVVSLFLGKCTVKIMWALTKGESSKFTDEGQILLFIDIVSTYSILSLGFAMGRSLL